MRITAKGITGIGAIAAAIAFAGCECSMEAGERAKHPPPPPAATVAPAAVNPKAASMANPPPPAPLPASVRERLEKKDGG